MPVLKAQTFRPAGKDAVVLDLGDLSRQAAKLRAIAEAKAERILSEAHAEADRLTAGAAEQGDARGYAEGLQRGLEEGCQQGQAKAIAQHAETLAKLTAQWTRAIGEFDGKWEAFEREATAAALQLAVRLAEKVVHRAVATDDAVVVEQARAALARVLEPAAVQLRLCPEDRPALEAALPEITAQLTNVRGVELIDDPGVGRGGCVVVNGSGRIDATVQTQLDRLCEHLLGTIPAPDDPASDTEPPPISDNGTDPPPPDA